VGPALLDLEKLRASFELDPPNANSRRLARRYAQSPCVDRAVVEAKGIVERGEAVADDLDTSEASPSGFLPQLHRAPRHPVPSSPIGKTRFPADSSRLHQVRQFVVRRAKKPRKR
jgi:hypothetical protein